MTRTPPPLPPFHYIPVDCPVSGFLHNLSISVVPGRFKRPPSYSCLTPQLLALCNCPSLERGFFFFDSVPMTNGVLVGFFFFWSKCANLKAIPFICVRPLGNVRNCAEVFHGNSILLYYKKVHCFLNDPRVPCLHVLDDWGQSRTLPPILVFSSPPVLVLLRSVPV